MMVSAYPRQENYHLAPTSWCKQQNMIRTSRLILSTLTVGIGDGNSFLQIDIATKMPHDITHYLSMLYNRILKRY